MKAKKLKEALAQMAEEGVVQLFSPKTARPPLSALSGRCNLMCCNKDCSSNIRCRLVFEMSRFSICRWISADERAELERFMAAHRGDMARDLDGDPVFLAPNSYSLNYEAERWKAIRFNAIKDYQVRGAKAA